MDLKKCEKCAELVEEAKAFCPECGNPFVVEEKREESSEFDKLAGTLALTQSSYNMMLSKMELESSQSPDAEPEAETISEQVSPVKEIVENNPNVDVSPVQDERSGVWFKYALVGGVILTVLFVLLVAALYILLTKTEFFR